MVPARGKMPPGRTPHQPSTDQDILASLSDRHQRRLQRTEAKRARDAVTDAQEEEESHLSAGAEAKNDAREWSGPTKTKAAKYRAKLTTLDMGLEAMGSVMINETASTHPSESVVDAIACEEVLSTAVESSEHECFFRKTPKMMMRTRPTTSLLGMKPISSDHEDDTGISDEAGHEDETTGARQCTGLNSDDDSDDGDDDDDEWEKDRQLGDLSDEEPDSVPVKLPDSLCSSAAKNAAGLREMKRSGWEYDPQRFGPAPTYAGLYDGPYGPSDSHTPWDATGVVQTLQEPELSRKYYKTLFLGLVDMALVNAFIGFRHYKKVNAERPAKHYAFFENLMDQLLAVDAKTYESIHAATRAENRTAVSPARSTSNEQRTPVQMEELVVSSDTPDTVQGKKTKRQRSCKVCDILKTKPRKYSQYYCPECSSAVARECGPAIRLGKKRRRRVETAKGDEAGGGSHSEDHSRNDGDSLPTGQSEMMCRRQSENGGSVFVWELA
ncbi:Pleiotropic drug resistance protein [Phytophthora palmivora]|uniref:Pleiotropic drug resistance protein n=1 Tax=Phytophthora palmivora TaxID=4796 RepID=A0A2P4X9I4_9STRA|nr:Pleiotropic drug resistance protein [Phytophthora palmivora]